LCEKIAAKQLADSDAVSELGAGGPAQGDSRAMVHPLEKDSDGRYPVIEAVIAELGSRRDHPLDRLVLQLRSCGYLVERSGERVVLSDNAHRYDFRDLAEWLPLGPEALETFPWVREFSRRGLEGSSGFELGRERFLKRVHGYKTPASFLDGLVAYLVKALSAAGVLTNWSCAGHVGFLGVGLEMGCSSAWTAILIRSIGTRLGLDQTWNVENALLSVRGPVGGDWVRYYLEVLEVADSLYRERVRFREIRGKIVGQMDERAEEWAYECILSRMESLLRDSPFPADLGMPQSRSHRQQPLSLHAALE
jgi:hypothetical protein